MMKNHLKFAIKMIIFVIIACICVGITNEWLKPEYYFNQDWPSTNTYRDFYKLEKNSVDVLFFGSSHAVASFNPQVIYDDFGITSYNLGSEQQSLVISYFWLLEALKYQSPKAVVLDTYTVHPYLDAFPYNDMNCSEGAVRKAMDDMRLSPLKWQAGRIIEKIDPTQSGLSFLFLNIRYHTRWTNIDRNDYIVDEMLDHGGVKGYTTLGGTYSKLHYKPFREEDSEKVEAEAMTETAREYLNKIVELCEEKKIQLILTQIPSAEPIARHKSIKMYADAHDLPFYDFNEEKLYKAIDYNAAENLLSHPNYLGAEKISSFIGDQLKNKYGISSRTDPSYDKSRAVYEHLIENIELRSTADIYQYLDLLDNEKYSVFIFAALKFGTYIDEEIMNKLNALGFREYLPGVSEYMHYCAVKDGNEIFEKLTASDLKISGTVDKGSVQYEFKIDTSIPLFDYRTYSMVINRTECGNHKTGLNIVVYDNDLKTIIDKVNFDTNQEEIPAEHY